MSEISVYSYSMRTEISNKSDLAILIIEEISSSCNYRISEVKECYCTK